MLVIEEKSQVSEGLQGKPGPEKDYRWEPESQGHSPSSPGSLLPRASQPSRTYPELCQVELRRIIAQHGHERGGPRLSEQAPAEGGSRRVHSLAVPGDVAGGQADQHVVHVQWWPEHRLRKGREGSAVPTGELETGPQTPPQAHSASSLPFCLTPH